MSRRAFEKSEIPFRNMGELSAPQRSGMLWLTIDDMLERVAVSRTTLWNWVNQGNFPAPYKWKGNCYWTAADLNDWIDTCVSRSQAGQNGLRHDPRKGKTPPTWKKVRKLLKSKTSALTNKQIAFLLDAYYADVSALTRLMALAGELVAIKPIHSHDSGMTFYSYRKRG